MSDLRLSASTVTSASGGFQRSLAQVVTTHIGGPALTSRSPQDDLLHRIRGWQRPPCAGAAASTAAVRFLNTNLI